MEDWSVGVLEMEEDRRGRAGRMEYWNNGKEETKVGPV
jgi:hypothetical protein